MRDWRVDPAKLHRLRFEAQLTPEQLAAQVGCHFNHYRKFERPVRRTSFAVAEPSDQLMWKILNTLSVKLDREVRVEDVARPKIQHQAAA